jgi:hypothetical protein
MDERDRDLTERDSGTLTRVLTPKASAITGFTFAVLAMTGQGTWTQAIQALWGASFPQSRVTVVLASAATATLLLAVAGFLLGRRTLAATTAGDAWEAHLARAAMVVAGLAAALSAVSMLLGLLRYGTS